LAFGILVSISLGMKTVLFLGFVALITSLDEHWTAVEKEIKMPLPLLRTLNEGIANDGTNWFFSQQHFLVATTVDPLEVVLGPNYDATPKELKDQNYNHIGDIDVAEGVIYGGIEQKDGNGVQRNGLGVLAKWKTTDLSLISYKVTQQDGMPWVAVNPKTRLLYSAVWNSAKDLAVYDMDTFEAKEPLTIDAGLPGEIQGGAFYNDDLYLAVNGNCSVWKLNLAKKELTKVLSDNELFRKHEYEMEGIDFWDLRDRGLGLLHVYGNYMSLEEKGIRSFVPPSEQQH